MNSIIFNLIKNNFKYKVKKKYKNSLLQVISTILFLVLVLYTKTGQNLSNIFTNNYEARFSQTYDFCAVESVGYLNYVKKKYKLFKRPKIINYVHTPDLNWVIIDPKEINNYSEYKILLNYPGQLINLKFKRKNNNTYQVSKLNFYRDKTNIIKRLEIKFKKKFKTNKEIKLELYSDAITKTKNKIRTYSNFIQEKDDKIVFNLNLNLINNRNDSESLTFKIKNLKENNIDTVKFIALNKYNIEEYSIIDSHDNCYLIK